MTVKAALHVHSTFSDGEMTLAELRAVYLAAGCQVVCMADHADTFDADRVASYVEACRAVSDEKLLFVPGLEHGCEDRMHIVSYGATTLIPTGDPQAVIAQIEQSGGMSVIAHPRPQHLERIALYDILPSGIEAWNTKYDGRYAPRPAVFELVARVRLRKPALLAFYGQDMHWRRQHRGLFNLLEVDSIDGAGVLAALRAGRFVGVKDQLRLPSDGGVSPLQLRQFGQMNARAGRWLAWLRTIKRWSGPVGRALPAPIKAQLRRFF